MLLKKALYGYAYSGKFLFEDQKEFLVKEGFISCPSAPAIWKKQVETSSGTQLILVIVYSDDWLYASTCTNLRSNSKRPSLHDLKLNFKDAQTGTSRLQSHAMPKGNLYLDQQRYAASIVQRYIPTAVTGVPTDEDCNRFSSPVPPDFKFSKEDQLPTEGYEKDLKELETEFGFCIIEVAGSLNYLSHTGVESLFAICKLCRFTHRPGRPHFKAALHLLHHIRCHPPKALKFYHSLEQSPVLSEWFPQTDHSNLDLLLSAFSDLSWGDFDEQLSTGGYMIAFNGSLVDFSSFIPGLITLSSAEAKLNALSRWKRMKKTIPGKRK